MTDTTTTNGAHTMTPTKATGGTLFLLVEERVGALRTEEERRAVAQSVALLVDASDDALGAVVAVVEHARAVKDRDARRRGLSALATFRKARKTGGK